MPGATESKPKAKIVYRGETTEQQISNAIIADRLDQVIGLLESFLGQGRIPIDLYNTIRLCQQERLEIIQGDDGKDAPPSP